MKTRFSFNYLYLSLAGLSLCLGSGCGDKKNSTLPEAHAHAEHTHNHLADLVHLSPAQKQFAGIVLNVPEQRNLSGEIKVTGMAHAEPNHHATVHALMQGVVSKIFVKPGAFVQAGTLLATLKHQEIIQLQQDYLVAQSKIIFLEQEFKRQESLQADNVGYLRKLQQAQAELATERATLSALKARLELLKIPIPAADNPQFVNEIPIIAPINGVLKDLKINVGAFIRPEQPLFEIINADELHLELQVFEQYVNQLEVGMPLWITVAGKKDAERFQAKIITIGQMIDEKSRTLSIHAHFTGNEPVKQTLLPGMYLVGGIPVKGLKQMVVPDAAVVRNQNRTFVFTDTPTPDTYQLLEVRTGVSADGYTEIMPARELKADEKIVFTGAYFLLAEMRKGEGAEDGHGH